MKTTCKYIIMALACGLVMASCQKALEKAEVEAGFAPKGPVPSVTAPTLVEIAAIQKKVTVSAEYANYSMDMDSLELGFLVSTDSTFATSKAVLLETLPENGKVTVDIPVLTGAKNYIKATASTISGSCISEALVVDVPVVPWYQILSDTYTAKFESYPGNPYEHTIEVALSEDLTAMTFTNFDAWAASQDVPTVVTGSVDLEKGEVSVPLVDGFFDIGLSQFGIVGCPMVWNEEAEDLDFAESYKIVFSSDASKMMVQSFGVYAGGFAELYYDQVYEAF